MSNSLVHQQEYNTHSISYLQYKVSQQQAQIDVQQEEIEHLKIALINVQSVVNGMLRRELE